MTTAVEVSPAGPEQKALIAGLFQFYVYDFSEFEPAASGDFELNAETRYDPYPYLDDYWTDPACIPLLIKWGERVAGFALINSFFHSGGVLDHSMAEFFVLRKYRREGVGARAVAEILARYPGRWEISVLDRNAPAMVFWPRTVSAMPGVSDLKTIRVDPAQWRGPILQFVAARLRVGGR